VTRISIRTIFLSLLWIFILSACTLVAAQQPTSPNSSSDSGSKSASKSASSDSNQTPRKPSAAPEVVIVTGTFEPIPLSESNRSVTAFDTSAQPFLYNSIVDYLELDPALDLRQREVDGVQADLSIRGSSFEQSLVLLNGLRINDAQSGHHDLDIPLPRDSISRIEVLDGVGSTLYGADAVGGAVNFITTRPTTGEIRARIGFGNFGFNQQALTGSYVCGRWSEQLATARDDSSGFRFDRDYRSSAISSETRFKSPWGETDVLLAGSDRPFGADQFYGNFPSWERTKSWFASISQTLGKNTDLAFGYRRHSDEFVLVRDDPSLYENNHVSQSWEGAVRRRTTIQSHSTVAYGLEADADEIDSNNLGHHSRNHGAGYLNFDVQFWKRVFLSFGTREELFSGGRSEFAPAVAGGVWLGQGVRLRASASRGFRLPTYTDLYYSDPANLGNPRLKPESAWGFEAGPEWNPGGRLSAELTGFYRRERNDIDYVKYSASAPWQATNIGKLNFTGVEAMFRVRLSHQELTFGYTGLHGNEPPQPGLISKYVFDYPSHNATFAWFGQIKNVIALRNRVGLTQRFGQDAYPLWDFAVSRIDGRFLPYLQFSNLSNTGYEEIPGVSMPGRSVIGGIAIVLGREAKP
jgi:outer membrane cobalamin receptor